MNACAFAASLLAAAFVAFLSSDADAATEELVTQVTLEEKGWGSPDKTIVLRRGSLSISVRPDLPRKSTSARYAFAADRFQAIAVKVGQIGFFDLPSTFSGSYDVDGAYFVIAVRTNHGRSKEITLGPATEVPTGLRDLIESIRNLARQFDSRNF